MANSTNLSRPGSAWFCAMIVELSLAIAARTSIWLTVKYPIKLGIIQVSATSYLPSNRLWSTKVKWVYELCNWASANLSKRSISVGEHQIIIVHGHRTYQTSRGHRILHLFKRDILFCARFSTTSNHSNDASLTVFMLGIIVSQIFTGILSLSKLLRGIFVF